MTTLINAASSRNKLHPGDIRRVISDSVPDSNSSQASIAKSSLLRPKGKLAANMLQYKISRNNVSSNHGALVDRGANGGISGNDVRIITTSTRRVDVSGINNHELTHLPIVTAGGVVSSQRGEIIIILNQYAHLHSGKTILSSIQMESFGNKVDDCSIRIDANAQSITTNDGYVFHL